MLRFCTDSTRLPGGRTVRLALAVERLRQVAPDHRLHDAGAVEVGLVVGHDMLAVAQDRDAVGEEQRFLQRVRDEDDRDAARLRSRTRSKKYFFSSGVSVAVGSSKMMTLASCSTARAISTICFLAAPSRLDDRRRVDVEIERLQELLGGDVDAAQPVEELLLAEKQVLRHRHGRHQAVLLEHHRDAEMPRLERRSRGDLAALDQHLSRGQRDDAGHHLGQRRLAGAVLADQRVDLAAPQREIDAVDRRHAGVDFGRLAQLEDGRGDGAQVAHDCRLRSASATDRRSTAAALGEHEQGAVAFDRGHHAVVVAVDPAVQRVAQQALLGEPDHEAVGARRRPRLDHAHGLDVGALHRLEKRVAGVQRRRDPVAAGRSPPSCACR